MFFDETNPKSRVMAYRLPHLGLTLFGGLGLMLAGASLRKRLLPTIVTVVLDHGFPFADDRLSAVSHPAGADARHLGCSRAGASRCGACIAVQAVRATNSPAISLRLETTS